MEHILSIGKAINDVGVKCVSTIVTPILNKNRSNESINVKPDPVWNKTLGELNQVDQIKLCNVDPHLSIDVITPAHQSIIASRVMDRNEFCRCLGRNVSSVNETLTYRCSGQVTDFFVTIVDRTITQ